MKPLYALICGSALGIGSISIYSFYPPVGLILSLAATAMGIWSTGRIWGKRSYKLLAGIAWCMVVLRAGFPGVNEEFLVQGDSIGISLINFGFIAVVIGIVTPL